MKKIFVEFMGYVKSNPIGVLFTLTVVAMLAFLFMNAAYRDAHGAVSPALTTGLTWSIRAAAVMGLILIFKNFRR